LKNEEFDRTKFKDNTEIIQITPFHYQFPLVFMILKPLAGKFSKKKKKFQKILIIKIGLFTGNLTTFAKILRNHFLYKKDSFGSLTFSHGMAQGKH
jgi:hypothetical protein